MIKELKDQTSEEIHKISKQPEPTCPLIDKTIELNEKVLDALKRWERDGEDFESLASRCEDAEWSAAKIEDKLESIRANVELIRNWGQEWKELALEVINERCQQNTFEGQTI